MTYEINDKLIIVLAYTVNGGNCTIDRILFKVIGGVPNYIQRKAAWRCWRIQTETWGRFVKKNPPIGVAHERAATQRLESANNRSFNMSYSLKAMGRLNFRLRMVASVLLVKMQIMMAI